MHLTLKRLVSLLQAALFISAGASAQSLPDEMSISPDGRMLLIGSQPHNGYYDQSLVRRIDLTFASANFWTQLLNNYSSKTYLPATLQIDGITYDSVGVRFRGNTSFQTGSSQKKSFKIELDNWKSTHDYDGYSTFKLNNAAQDPSMMREVFYTTMIRRHIPTAKSSFVKLYLNGSNWGLYSNVQQLNKDFLEEWYLSNDGIWWRADKPPGSGGGFGGWGDGTAALNYLTNDTSTYKQYYTLKESSMQYPWDYLVRLCDKLENTPLAALEDTMDNYMDLDRTLWYLASEIAWTDDDSYVYKGKMDYYVHYEPETGLMVPHEYDGNSALETVPATSWGVFYNATNANYPLLNRLLNVPALRQRYLAHMRTIIAEEFDTAFTNATFASFRALVDTVVQNDPKKMYTYTLYNSEVQVLKNFINNRKTFINGNTEIQQVAPVIANAPYYSNGNQYQQPSDQQPVLVRSQISSATGIDNVQLYYSNNIVGRFSKTQMFDDGLHDDSLSNDGIYGATIPGFAAGSWVRYYIQAAAANTPKSVSYLPAGAEHNVFIYTVAPVASADTAIVINEVMASNVTTAADNFGEYDDWIELYNKSNNAVDISGYRLTDNPVNLDKWVVPAGTIIQPNDYLIIWADEDSSQGAYHANFKLSGSGEILMLLDTALNIVDSTSWGLQIADQGYARVPNGTGSFIIQGPTFSANNNSVGIGEISSAPVQLSVYPNPATDMVQIQIFDDQQRDLEIYTAVGQHLDRLSYSPFYSLSTSDWPAGIYFVRCGEAVKKLVVRH
ncbi:MAG: CotH kinase family protein [Bacteroidia bacterium]|nr:CotH kinase family protein [Bacteroidia bacterium]